MITEIRALEKKNTQLQLDNEVKANVIKTLNRRLNEVRDELSIIEKNRSEV